MEKEDFWDRGRNKLPVHVLSQAHNAHDFRVNANYTISYT